ncbi:MAG TPA: neutral/alkaline non-lysosomal ceramidase N-terminal domain-containing protein, partial [Flavitalea sp.]|nr:neutral/alkaline non-lysosomal ceramidase N-terminal domain-containing protein [Flavitalea sp.]
MKTCCKIVLLIFGLSVLKPASGQTMRAGAGRKIITPTLPFLLTGYAGRDKPATEKVHDIWAKALFIEASDKSRIVIITTDILGLSPEIENRVTDSLQKKYRLNRSDIVLNSSHTHSGPFIWPVLGMIGDYDSTTLRSFTSYG